MNLCSFSNTTLVSSSVSGRTAAEKRAWLAGCGASRQRRAAAAAALDSTSASMHDMQTARHRSYMLEQHRQQAQRA